MKVWSMSMIVFQGLLGVQSESNNNNGGGLGPPSFRWAIGEDEKIVECGDLHTFLIRYDLAGIIVAACMKDYEPERPEYCNYLGYLNRPTYIPISATGVCVGEAITKDNPILITIMADDNPEIDASLFWQRGVYETEETKVESEKLGRYDLVLESPGSNVQQELLDQDPSNAEDRSLRHRQAILTYPANGFVLKTQIVLDNTFVKKFQSILGENILDTEVDEVEDGSEADKRVAAIMCHAQCYWYAKRSLGTSVRIDFRSLPIKRIRHEISANENDLHKNRDRIPINVKVLIQETSSLDTRAFVYLCFQNETNGQIGLAFIRTTCHPNPVYRTSIIEYNVNDAFTGSVVAHEIGHNLGMHHDFLPGDAPRPCPTDPEVTCTGVGGVMDYNNRKFNNVTTWTCCSQHDFCAYYQMLGSRYCLPPGTSTDTLLSWSQ